MELRAVDAPEACVAPLPSLPQAPILTLPLSQDGPKHSTSSPAMRGTPETCAFSSLIEAPQHFQTPAQLQPIPRCNSVLPLPQPSHSLVASLTQCD